MQEKFKNIVGILEEISTVNISTLLYADGNLALLKTRIFGIDFETISKQIREYCKSLESIEKFLPTINLLLADKNKLTEGGETFIASSREKFYEGYLQSTQTSLNTLIPLFEKLRLALLDYQNCLREKIHTGNNENLEIKQELKFSGQRSKIPESETPSNEELELLHKKIFENYFYDSNHEISPSSPPSISMSSSSPATSPLNEDDKKPTAASSTSSSRPQFSEEEEAEYIKYYSVPDENVSLINVCPPHPPVIHRPLPYVPSTALSSPNTSPLSHFTSRWEDDKHIFDTAWSNASSREQVPGLQATTSDLNNFSQPLLEVEETKRNLMTGSDYPYPKQHEPLISLQQIFSAEAEAKDRGDNKRISAIQNPTSPVEPVVEPVVASQLTDEVTSSRRRARYIHRLAADSFSALLITARSSACQTGASDVSVISQIPLPPTQVINESKQRQGQAEGPESMTSRDNNTDDTSSQTTHPLSHL